MFIYLFTYFGYEYIEIRKYCTKGKRKHKIVNGFYHQYQRFQVGYGSFMLKWIVKAAFLTVFFNISISGLQRTSIHTYIRT